MVGSSASLGLLQQSGADEDPDTYVTFQTPGPSYIGYHSFYVPNDIQASLISNMLMQINFKGPAPSTQTWTWSIYDWNTHLWVDLGNTGGVSANQWQAIVLIIRDAGRYVSSGREIRIRLVSNNTNGDAKLDYEALHITYRPGAPGPTPAAPTVPAERPGIASARTPVRRGLSNPASAP